MWGCFCFGYFVVVLVILSLEADGFVYNHQSNNIGRHFPYFKSINQNQHRKFSYLCNRIDPRHLKTLSNSISHPSQTTSSLNTINNTSIKNRLISWIQFKWSQLFFHRAAAAQKAGQTSSLHPVQHRPRSSISSTLIKDSQLSSFLTKMLVISSAFIWFLRKPVHAMGGGPPPSAATAGSSSPINPVQGMILWCVLFTISALLHSAESAITKVSIWRVREINEDEGSNSPFIRFEENLTRFLYAILLTTTACGIYGTALFFNSITLLLPQLSLGLATAALTILTLLFGELLPKALAVANSEVVARFMLPIISKLAMVLYPLTSTIYILSDYLLTLFQMRVSPTGEVVSEDMLRRVVDEAQRSEKGIESGEGRMIKGVLDMQDKEVGRIMKPRIAIQAVPLTATAGEILRRVLETRYSRVPVYNGDIDHIEGIIFAKDLLDYIAPGEAAAAAAVSSSSTTASIPSSSQQAAAASGSSLQRQYQQQYLLQQQQQQVVQQANLAERARLLPWEELHAKDLMEEAFFIPETMSCWDALQEMKKRRQHMAIIIDEYGGTSGLVTFEDILEEVVGEIYDEDDTQEEQEDDWTIMRLGGSSDETKETTAGGGNLSSSGSGGSNSEGMVAEEGDDESYHNLEASSASSFSDYGGDNNNAGGGSSYYPASDSDNDFVPASNKGRGRFMIKASADVDDVCEALEIVLDEVDPQAEGGAEEEQLLESIRRGEYSTLGGLLCAIAGRIPKEKDRILFAGYEFTVDKVEDNRRLKDISVRWIGSQRGGGGGAGSSSFSSTMVVTAPAIVSTGSSYGNGNGNGNHYSGYNSNNSNGIHGNGNNYSPSSAPPINLSKEEVSLLGNINSRSNIDSSILLMAGSGSSFGIGASSDQQPSLTPGQQQDEPVLQLLRQPNEDSSNSSNGQHSSNNSNNSAAPVEHGQQGSNNGNGSNNGKASSSVRYDSKSDKLFIFRDGEWVDPDNL